MRIIGVALAFGGHCAASWAVCVAEPDALSVKTQASHISLKILHVKSSSGNIYGSSTDSPLPRPTPPHPRSAVREVNDEIRQLVADMAETMYEAPGIGLAATQVNDPRGSWSLTSPKTNRPWWP
jgi:hypothetical protein